MTRYPIGVMWTNELGLACREVAHDTTPSPYGWHDQDEDIRSRAREFITHQAIGHMTDMNVEYFTCLYSRLDVGGNVRQSHQALKDAWSNAYQLSQTQAG
jgi:hypothetical protein